jgi:hypothetical protein
MNESDFVEVDVPEDLDTEELAQEREAQRFEEMAGDLTGWHRVKRPIRIRRGGPSHSFSVRFAPDEIDLLQETADEQNVTLTEFIRNAALSLARSRGEMISRSEVRELLESVQSAVTKASERAGL